MTRMEVVWHEHADAHTAVTVLAVTAICQLVGESCVVEPLMGFIFTAFSGVSKPA